jgi:hypothetical protein
MNKTPATHLKTAAIAAAAAAVFAVSTASAETKTYIACNQWNECWKVKEHVTKYPTDVHVVYRDATWWEQHQHDSQWREMPDPSDDNGWYDKDGVWHAFDTASPPPP